MIRNIWLNIVKDRVLQVVSIIWLALLFLKPMNIADIDVNTIVLLFNLMLIIALIKRVGMLDYISEAIIKRVKTTRQVVIWMTMVSFISSMLVTNDVAIITLVPLYIMVAKKYELPFIYPIILITIAANLGSAVTPIGNPQNVFLVEYYKISLKQFFGHSLWLLILGLITITVLLMFCSNKEIDTSAVKNISIKNRYLLMVSALLILVLLAQFSIISIWLDLLITLLLVETINYKCIADVDYSLLLSFVGFFLIVGMISRFTWIVNMINHFTGNSIATYLTSMGSSEVISNVPTAVLISKFSGNFSAIYAGVSIGGLGTLVASLANLLAYKQVSLNLPEYSNKFIKYFLLINVILLALLSMVKIFFI